MPRTIRILPDAVANQIAAGEVVERPASVVKELVENALDADAGRVEVEIEGGGKRRIRVADDGGGMSREDALLSLDRHATSKIHSADDLRGVGTFGFRGEALPSIASVSRLTLETRRQADEVGTRIRVKGGRITGVEDTARTPGSTVTVEGLFFNAPARARFLQSPAAETRAVSESLAPLALANPAVAITLRSGDKALMELAGTSDPLERVGELWGPEVAAQMIHVQVSREGMSLLGFVQRPDAVRAGFRRTALFVGGRPFREAALLRAVDRGYRTTIAPDHRPWVVLFLEVGADAVDVNVHPTKAEVRFRHRNAVEALVEEGVRSALEGLESAATMEIPRTGESREEAETPGPGPDTSGKGVGEPGAVRERSNPPPAPSAGPSEDQMALFLPEMGDGEGGVGDEWDGDAASSAHEDELPVLERPRLWQIHRSWILAEVRDGLLLIDQHAAHERILFERIMARFDGEGVESQRLLFPMTIRLTPAEYELVEDLKGLLNQAGFEVEGFGGDTVIVHAVPDPHPHFDAERSFREMVDELTHGSELVRSARNQHERVAMSFACKSAIKAGQALEPSEMQELFDQLFATRLPFHDVHGRPTTVRLSRAELERKFGR
jgi:DNA mismatch repair protein MutL